MTLATYLLRLLTAGLSLLQSLFLALDEAQSPQSAFLAAFKAILTSFLADLSVVSHEALPDLAGADEHYLGQPLDEEVDFFEPPSLSARSSLF